MTKQEAIKLLNTITIPAFLSGLEGLIMESSNGELNTTLNKFVEVLAEKQTQQLVVDYKKDKLELDNKIKGEVDTIKADAYDNLKEQMEAMQKALEEEGDDLGEVDDFDLPSPVLE